MVQIKNTISFAYPNGSAKPSMDEMADFVKTLDANLGDMDAMYRIAEEKCVFIKMKSEASMHYVLMHNPEQLTFRYADGKVAEVRMSVAGGNVQYVRIYDLPPEVPDGDLSLVLGKYGTVKRVIREKFPVELGLDLYTGVRGVYMDVEKEIPSSLNFADRKGNIFYSGNKNKCFLCKSDGHQIKSCPKRKARKQRPDEERKQDDAKCDQDKDTRATSSYAGVVATGATVETIEMLDEEVMAIDEMTSGTEEIETGEQPSGNQTQQRVKYDYRKDPTYIAAKLLFDEQQRNEEKKKKEERKILRARENASTKQSPPRKK